ncbi:hypothetical protein GGR56DRAFT_327593 [Xylariaceae sp. FL0804]|nr:hypothetical protein GGR56DRAFT_327593 [Xylariaceae sp. FL0804]
MRPLAFRHCLPRHSSRLLSRSIGSRPAGVSGRFTVSAPPSASKGGVLDKITSHAKVASSRAQVGNVDANDFGATILASHDFTTWLEDPNFLSALLHALFRPLSSHGARVGDVDVLLGVTDGLSPRHLLSEPQTGFSILYGSASHILPDLWNPQGFEDVSPDTKSTISFLTSPLDGNPKPLEITLPLANTIFKNGRRSTLSASMWESSSGVFSEMGLQPKRTQRIGAVDITEGDQYIWPMVPLIPITPPRKIVAGLGNIIRQVEVRGNSVPASMELETVITRIFQARATGEKDGASSARPIGVWCWVIPPHVAQHADFGTFHNGVLEATRGSDAMFRVQRLLSSECRLHRIVSGGGGWGSKKGLLSLDPQTELMSEPDSLDMFVQSFEQRNIERPSASLVAPGSYVMFCSEPHWPKKLERGRLLTSHTLSLGVAPNDENRRSPQRELTPDSVEVINSHFGATTSDAIYLKTVSDDATTGGEDEVSDDAITGGEDEAAQTPVTYTTKVDVPGANFSLARRMQSKHG